MEGKEEDEESPLPKPETMPPSALMRGKEKGKEPGRATREMLMERDRRGKMNELYTQLNSMVPSLFPKATREKTIDETIAYIRELEEHIMELEAQQEKVEVGGDVTLHRRRNSSSSIEVTFSGETVFFGIQSKARKGLLSRVLRVFERHKVKVLATTITCNDGQQARVTVTAAFDRSDRMVFLAELSSQMIKSDILRSL